MKSKEATMSDTVQTLAVEETPSLETLKELYSHQHRDCWLCKSYSDKLTAGKDLKEEELWHFAHCIMSWELVNHDNSEEMEKAA